MKIILISVLLALAGAVLQPAPLFAAEAADTGFRKESEIENEKWQDDAEFIDEDLVGAGNVVVPDPLKSVNRVFYQFNDKLYFWVLKPVALGYKAVVPTEIRVCSLNFFNNLRAPVRFTSCLLQGKFKNAAAEFGQFFINTTAGVLGLADIARRYPELNPPEEDFGQTLGYWGIGNGFYLVLPVLGPSTLRDGFGRLGDWAVDPLSYLNPWELSIGVSTYKNVNATSFRIGDYETIKDAAIDPYESFRDGYIQYRRTKVAQ